MDDFRRQRRIHCSTFTRILNCGGRTKKERSPDSLLPAGWRCSSGRYAASDSVHAANAIEALCRGWFRGNGCSRGRSCAWELILPEHIFFSQALSWIFELSNDVFSSMSVGPMLLGIPCGHCFAEIGLLRDEPRHCLAMLASSLSVAHAF